jgi:hypothetical protein
MGRISIRSSRYQERDLTHRRGLAIPKAAVLDADSGIGGPEDCLNDLNSEK